MSRSCSRIIQSILYLKRTATRERYGVMKSASSDSNPKVFIAWEFSMSVHDCCSAVHFNQLLFTGASQSPVQIKGALDASQADILSAYSTEQGKY